MSAIELKREAKLLTEIGFTTKHETVALELIFVLILITDAAKQNEDWDAIGKTDPNIQIPLLMQNKIPDGYETDDKLDVSLRPDEVP